MKRTQIYLDDDIYEYLESESKNKHKSMSLLIRESIKTRMMNENSNLLKNASKVFGIWKDKDFEVDDYISNIRKDRIK